MIIAARIAVTLGMNTKNLNNAGNWLSSVYFLNASFMQTTHFKLYLFRLDDFPEKKLVA